MRIALLVTDNREHHRKYDLTTPYFGTAIEAILQGLAHRPELEIHVVSCSQAAMQSPEKIADNIWFHLLRVPNIGWLKTGYQGCIRTTRQKLREIQPDLVHGQGTERDCSLCAVFSGFLSIITIHGNVAAIAESTKAPIGSYWWWMAILERFTLPRTCGVFCNSKHTESLVKPRARKTWFVPNALRREFFDTPIRERSISSKPVLLNIGTISPLKQQLALLEMAEALYREGHSFEFQFIGPADPRLRYAATFLQRVEAAERDGFARYLGTRSLRELIEALDSAAALVHVPFEEAFGLVAAEALARNLNLFGFNVGGLSEIGNGVQGANLLSFGDWNGLKDAIRDWFADGMPRSNSAANVMRQRYHPEIIARRHLEIYQEVLAAS